MSAELGREHKEYRRPDERFYHMPAEAMRYEEDIYVSLFTGTVNQLPETIYFVGTMLQAQLGLYKCVSLRVNYQSRDYLLRGALMCLVS